MILYISIVLIAMLIISILNIMFGVGTLYPSALYVVGMVTLSVVFEILIDGLFAIIVQKLPNRWFSNNKGFFNVSKKEQHFYEKLGIKFWKDKVWELGSLGGFSKSKIVDPKNPAYISQFLMESNKGIVTHIIGMFVGFLNILIMPIEYALHINIPVAIVNLILNVLPTLILRYNIPKLMVARKRAIRQLGLNIDDEEKKFAN